MPISTPAITHPMCAAYDVARRDEFAKAALAGMADPDLCLRTDAGLATHADSVVRMADAVIARLDATLSPSRPSMATVDVADLEQMRARALEAITAVFARENLESATEALADVVQALDTLIAEAGKS